MQVVINFCAIIFYFKAKVEEKEMFLWKTIEEKESTLNKQPIPRGDNEMVPTPNDPSIAKNNIEWMNKSTRLASRYKFSQ